MELETRKEPGCLAYAFTQEINDASTIRLIEQWESMAALKSHFGSPHMAAFGVAVGDLQPKSIDIKCFESSGEVALPA
jgi:quinol monooxygenase YgiN